MKSKFLGAVPEMRCIEFGAPVTAGHPPGHPVTQVIAPLTHPRQRGVLLLLLWGALTAIYQ